MQYLWNQKDYSKDAIINWLELISVHNDPYSAMDAAHAIAIITEWDEFKEYDWLQIYNNMKKPAFVFDGRNILDESALFGIGFNYKGIGN